MKTSLTIVLAFLLAVAMILINFVMIMLWQRDLVAHEIDKARLVLDCVQAMNRAHSDEDALVALLSNVFPGDTRGGVLIKGVAGLRQVPKDFSLSRSLSEVLTEVEQKGKEIVRVDSSLWPGAGNAGQAVLVGVSFKGTQGKRLSAGVARSLLPVYTKLCQAEKTILVYMIVNLLLLTLIGFYRFTQVAVKPIDRLVGLADQYQDADHLLFVAENSGNEYSRLATSLNSMLDRIKHDRVVLQENVRQLDLANRQLKSNQQEMIRAEKLASVGRMAAGLAHEIGNPLGVVQGYLGLLARSKSSVSEEERDFIRRAEDELQRVNTLIRQMLDFARVSEGAPEEFSVHDLVTSVIEMVRVQPAFKTVTIDCMLDAEQDIVYADQDQLRQVFVNCLINSADAVNISERKEKGLVTVATRLSTLQSGAELKSFLCVRISDNGTGISKEHQAVVFDPFFTTKEPGRGTGLGLSVSYAIIERLHGRMSIKNNETAGAVVEICLPLAGQVDNAISAHSVSQ